VLAKMKGWKASRWDQVQLVEQVSIDVRDQAVMDLLAATDVAVFRPRWLWL
jgi:hypothetical protein